MEKSISNFEFQASSHRKKQSKNDKEDMSPEKQQIVPKQGTQDGENFQQNNPTLDNKLEE